VLVELVVEVEELVVVGSEVVVDSATSSAGLQAARRSVSETNPAIAVRIARHVTNQPGSIWN